MVGIELVVRKRNKLEQTLTTFNCNSKSSDEQMYELQILFYFDLRLMGKGKVSTLTKFSSKMNG